MQAAGPATVQVSGTPTTAVVSWTLPTATILNASLGGDTLATKSAQPKQAPASVSSVTVVRLVANAAAVPLNNASPDAATANDPGPLTPGHAVTYRVKLMDGCTVMGAKDVSYIPPLPHDPSGLTATTATDGTVTLKWQPVDGVAGYQITGTTLATPVKVSYTTQWTSAPQAPGAQQWKIASVYQPGGVLTAASAWPSVMSHVVPTPGKLFLTMPNGNGSTADTQAYSRTFCTDPFADLSACSAAQFIRDATNWEQVWAEREKGPKSQWETVAFADTLDLGVGRMVNCAPRKNGVTVCWASSHFPRISASGDITEWPTTSNPAGATAGSNFPFLANQAWEFREARSLNIIVMSDTKAFFGSWKFDGQLVNAVEGHFFGGQWITSEPPWSALDAEHIYATGAELQTGAVLDTQGRKSVPNACLSCQIGRASCRERVSVTV
jgi:hypothetical protein